MSDSRGLVLEWENNLGRSSPFRSCLGKMCWLLLWGVLQACPTQGFVLLAQQVPQQLTSSGYPEPYLKGQESHTDIEAPEGFAVRLVFQDFDLEPSPDCEGDSVTISASGMDPVRLCGQQGSPLGNPPGHREFVSPGRSLQLIFQTHSSSKDKTTSLHKGFLAFYQAVGPLSCPAQGNWKDRQNRKEVLQCVPDADYSPSLPSLPVCGRPVTPMEQNPKTLGSSPAKPGAFPWQAFTSIYGRGGGALLGDRWVLTAAHTIYPKDSVYRTKNQSVEVFLGHTDVDELLRSGQHAVRRVVVHPDYRQHEPRDFTADLALLELQRPAALRPGLLPVCLPRSGSLYRSGRWGYVSGFGVDRGWLPTRLKYSRLQVAPREDCEAWLRERQRTEVFSDHMFCVGDKMQSNSVCQGDSGSVFVVWDDSALHWVATGIVSWGIGCGTGYGFYTKVLDYVDWIEGVMEGKD